MKITDKPAEEKPTKWVWWRRGPIGHWDPMSIVDRPETPVMRQSGLDYCCLPWGTLPMDAGTLDYLNSSVLRSITS